jgi:hypothetical protein
MSQRFTKRSSCQNPRGGDPRIEKDGTYATIAIVRKLRTEETKFQARLKIEGLIVRPVILDMGTDDEVHIRIAEKGVSLQTFVQKVSAPVAHALNNLHINT